MAGFWDFTGRVTQLAVTAQAGDMYKQGFNDARAGTGKSQDVVKNKIRCEREKNLEWKRAYQILITSYEDGYRDGLEREQMELNTKKSIRFGD